MKKTDIQVDEGMFATYCPEDDKLRLYVGRVPREEYQFLRSQGWTSTPKQDCDFVAVWTPSREDTALIYGGGEIEDEDQNPGSRAADRAERFAMYQGKRIAEATGHADGYEDGPRVHGYQDPTRAERAAQRHDRQGDKAVTQWSKAEYWQRRTAGVIANALYRDLPGVRMGRIKALEAEQRKLEKDGREAVEAAQSRFDLINRVLDHAEGRAEKLFNFSGLPYAVHNVLKLDETPDANPTPEQMRRACLSSALSSSYNEEARQLSRDVEEGNRDCAEVAREWLANNTRPEDWTPGRRHKHITLRLAYERQMLEGQGGTLESSKDVEPGGKIGGKLIFKANKSPATGRITSVSLLGPKVEGWTYKATNIPGTEYAEHQFSTERMKPEHYTAPTAESLAELEAIKKEISEARKAVKGEAIPLVNPTDEDAERLQAIWNQEARKYSGNDAYRARYHAERVQDQEPIRMTQTEYAGKSKGSYARASTALVNKGGVLYHRRISGNRNGTPCVKIRMTYGAGEYSANARRVIIITDKPQKPLPVAVWESQAVEVTA